MGSLQDELKKIATDALLGQIAQQNVVVGAVIRMHVPDTTPPKIKRFIVVGVTEDEVSLATVYINSEINQNVHFTAALREMHIPICADGKAYLDHDSYIDCSQFHIKDRADILFSVKKTPEAVIGKLTEAEWEGLKNEIIKSKGIKGKHKKKFGFYTD